MPERAARSAGVGSELRERAFFFVRRLGGPCETDEPHRCQWEARPDAIRQRRRGARPRARGGHRQVIGPQTVEDMMREGGGGKMEEHN
eukprot:3358022-Pyramimonas_sp.AAC.1